MKKKILFIIIIIILILAIVGGFMFFSKKEKNNKLNEYYETKEDNYTFELNKGKNGNPPIVKLNSEYEMPIIGLGTYSLIGDNAIEAVKSALKLGYRKIDTAHIYVNEKEIGQAIRESGVPREEIFVATKLYPNQYDDPESAIEIALETLDIEYIDLMLLHHPGTNDVRAYKTMEKYVKEGKIKSIGLSNWYIEEMEDFLPQVSITPTLVQKEIHPYYQETSVIKYMHEKGIAMEAWYPLGGRGHQKELLSDETLVKIAKNHNVSVAQVILRFDLQNGVIVIPGSSNPDYQLENISLFDFELTNEEMETINKLNRDEKHDWY